jgi:uncharacterized DUF497 family protein
VATAQLFEWDDSKAAENYERHGVSFETATGVFDDPFALEWIDDRYDYGEARYGILGMAGDRLLFVAYTVRGNYIRMISARGAVPYERRRYHEENTS